MSTGITYFCTDSHGNVYSRYSAQHHQPRYLWAIVYRPAGTNHKVTKANVSYSGKRPYGDGNEVVPVRAYPGRVASKQEPTAGFAFGAKPMKVELPTSAPTVVMDEEA